MGATPTRHRHYAADELITRLESAWQKLGRRPQPHEMRPLAGVSSNPYIRHWGSFLRACHLLVEHKNGRLSRESLLQPAPADVLPVRWRRARKPARNRAPLSVRTRWDILKRDRYRCTICGRSPSTDPTVQLQVDHVTPVSHGGPDTDSNLRTLCHTCNAGKSDRPD